MLPPSTFWLCLGAATLLRLVVAALLPLTLNEPYYWLWARHPALGYYDHPPLAAWLSIPFTFLGNSPLAVRAPAVACGTLAAALVHLYARRLTRSDDAAAFAGLAMLAAPYYSVMAVLAWPEFALLAAWAATLLAWHDALFEDGGPKAWLLAGVALGCSLLAKFTSFALAAGIALFFVVSPAARRRWLRTPWPYVAMLVALVVWSPFLAWNAAHAWVTFLFQAKERSQGGPTLHLEHLPNFLGETLGGLSPLVALALVPAVLEALRRAFATPEGERLRLPLAVSLPPLLAFWTLVPVATVQVYWTLCCYLGLFPLLGHWYVSRLHAEPARWRRRGMLAALLGVVPMLVAVVTVTQPSLMFALAGRPAGSGLTEMYGMPDVPAVVEQERQRLPHPERAFLAAEDHRLASHLLLLQARPVLMFSGDRRGMEYLRWESPAAHAGDDAVVLMRKPFEDGREGLRRKLVEAFDKVGPATPHLVAWQGRPAQTFYAVRCEGFHPERATELLYPTGAPVP